MIEITKACTVAFMKTKNWFFDVDFERNVSIGKKQEMIKTDFDWHSNVVHHSTKLLIVDLLSNRFRDKMMVCYLK